MDECKHCWHDTGAMLLSMPPKYPQVCCHCGATRIYAPPPPPKHDMSIPLHGPHAPPHAHVHRIVPIEGDEKGGYYATISGPVNRFPPIEE